MEAYQIIILVCCVVLLGVFVLPAVNRFQFRRMPYDQQVLAIMKQAKGLVYFKNVSHGRSGSLFYVKNKRKILVYPWYLDENGRMVIDSPDPFEKWDYPEEHPPLDADEREQAQKELENYARSSHIKIVFAGGEK